MVQSHSIPESPQRQLVATMEAKELEEQVATAKIPFKFANGKVVQVTPAWKDVCG